MVTARPLARRGELRVVRSDERGATMFIVLMVLMILSAIGTFALSTARYEVRTSGYRRQRAQAQLAANYGGFAAQMSMDPAKAAWFVQQLTKSGEPCQMNLGVGPCYHIYSADVERIAGLTASSEKVFVLPGTTSGQAEGSFGLEQINGGFRVELTEPADLVRPVAGWSLGSGDQSTVKFVDLTVTSMGVVFPDLANYGVVDANERAGAAYANARGHVVLGPLTQ